MASRPSARVNSRSPNDPVVFARRPGRDALRLLVLHDDPDREFDYVAGAEDALKRAKDRSWTVVSVKADWDRVFPET